MQWLIDALARMTAPMAESDASARAARIRRGAGLFRLGTRGLLVVEGRDRVRWLDGMVSNQVDTLESGAERSGCYALLLTPRGRIVSDLHVLQRGDVFWLELAAEAVEPARAHLEKLVISEDVRLSNATEATGRLALEGPRALDALTRALGTDPGLAPDCICEAAVAGALAGERVRDDRGLRSGCPRGSVPRPCRIRGSGP